MTVRGITKDAAATFVKTAMAHGVKLLVALLHVGFTAEVFGADKSAALAVSKVLKLESMVSPLLNPTLALITRSPVALGVLLPGWQVNPPPDVVP